MNRKTIFSFWEPKAAMSPYLKLCGRTWERYLPDFNITYLNYSNLGQYLPADTFNMETLKRLPLPLQKDAVMVAVLKEHGGTFLDADTLATQNISPLVAGLDSTEMIMFNTHLAFIAAGPNACVLNLWLEGIHRKMRNLDNMGTRGHTLNWDLLGNSVLHDVMDNMISGIGLIGKIQHCILDKGLFAARTASKTAGLNRSRSATNPAFLREALRRKKRTTLFKVLFRRQLTMLDRLKYGFIAEAAYFPARKMSPVRKYELFWFTNKVRTRDVYRNNQTIIGLHNSWTPRWYMDLSEKEVLDHDCLLSGTLKDLLERRQGFEEL